MLAEIASLNFLFLIVKHRSQKRKIIRLIASLFLMLLHLKSVLSRFTSLDQRLPPLLTLAGVDVTGRFYADTSDNLLCFTSDVFPSLDYQPPIMRCLGTPPPLALQAAQPVWGIWFEA